MKRIFLSAALFAAFALAACGTDAKTESAPPTKTPDVNARTSTDTGAGDQTNPQDKSGPEATPAAVKAEASALAKSAWAWLEANYDKVPEDPRMPFWGSKGFAPISGFVLSGALKAKVVTFDDAKVKETVSALTSSQASNGSWFLGAPGNSAVYSTSAVVSLFSYIRDHAGKDYPGYEAIVRAAKNGMEYLKKSQVGAPESALNDIDNTDMHYGGWAYSAEELGANRVVIDKETGKPKPAANLSTSIFALDAAAAFGLDKSDPLWERAQTFLSRHQNAGEADKGILIKTDDGKTVADPDAKDENYGGSRYSPNTTKAGVVSLDDDRVVLKSYGSMTYALLRAYTHTGLSKDSPRVKLAYSWLAKNFSVTKNPGFSAENDLDQQGLYYQYMQMARTLSLYGNEIKNPETDTTQKWKEMLLAQLKKSQAQDGSWSNDKDRWMEGAPVLATSYVINALGELIAN